MLQASCLAVALLSNPRLRRVAVSIPLPPESHQRADHLYYQFESLESPENRVWLREELYQHRFSSQGLPAVDVSGCGVECNCQGWHYELCTKNKKELKPRARALL